MLHINKTLFRENTEKVLSILWLSICIFIYIAFTAKVSYIQYVDVFDLKGMPEKLLIFAKPNYWGSLLWSILGLFLLSFAYISLGYFTARAIKFTFLFTISDKSLLSQFTSLASCYLLGQAVFISISLVFSGLLRLTPLLTLAMIGAGNLLGIAQFKKMRNDFLFHNSAKKHRPDFFSILTSLIFLLTILNTTARISYDSSAIYFSNAKLTSHLERMEFFTDGNFVASVFQNVIQYTSLIQLTGEQSARMLPWMSGLIICIFSLALGEKVGLTQKALSFLMLLLISSTAFLDLLGDAKVDLLSTAPAIGAIYWMITVEKTQEKQVEKMLFIGILMGLSITGRPFNAFLLGIFTLFYYLEEYIKDRKIKGALIALLLQLVWLGIGITLLGVFHLFVNWVLYRDPFAFFDSLTSINPSTGPWDNNPQSIFMLRIFYVFAATFRNSPQSLGNISPLVLGFLPALLWSKTQREFKFSKETKRLSLIAATGILSWILLFFTIVEIRYVLFLWIILFIPFAQLITFVLDTSNVFYQKIFIGLLTILLGFFLIRTVLIASQTYSPLDKQGNPICSEFILCEYLTSINETAKPGERVLTLSAFRYYLRSDLFYCSTQHNEYASLKELSYKDQSAFWEEVYRLGYNYIAFEEDYTTRHLQFGFSPSPTNLPEWLILERIDTSNTEVVAAYKIDVNNPPIEVIYKCQKNEKGIWTVIEIQ